MKEKSGAWPHRADYCTNGARRNSQCQRVWGLNNFPKQKVLLQLPGWPKRAGAVLRVPPFPRRIPIRAPPASTPAPTHIGTSQATWPGWYFCVCTKKRWAITRPRLRTQLLMPLKFLKLWVSGSRNHCCPGGRRCTGCRGFAPESVELGCSMPHITFGLWCYSHFFFTF